MQLKTFLSISIRLAAVLLACCSLAEIARAGEDLSPAPAGTFSVVVIPDTQKYLGRGTKGQPDSEAEVTNPVFAAHARWIAANLESQRIAFVSHVGDIVDKNHPAQWEVARDCMDVLHGKVPYGITVGNHDMTSSGDSSLFQQYFPAERFSEFDWYGGCFAGNSEHQHVSGNNANSFALFSAAGEDFVILQLECNAPDDVLAWADDVLTQHAGRRAIVTTHMDLGPIEKPEESRDYFDAPKGRMQWTKIHGPRGNSAQQMWDKCFRKHANLLLIFSGDQSRTSAMHLETKADDGHTVHALLSDYTSSGPLRIYRFHPQRSEIDVITYDTTRDTLVDDTQNVPGRENHQFTLRY